MSSHRNKRILKTTISESAIITSSELAGQRYGISQDLTDRLSTGVASRVRKHVTEGYQRTASLPTSSFSLSTSFPNSFPTFITSNEAITLAHQQHEFDTIKYLTPVNQLRPMWDLESEHEERRRIDMNERNMNMDTNNTHWGNGITDFKPDSTTTTRGKKRIQSINDLVDDESDLDELTDTDEPSRPPLYPTSFNTTSTSSSSSLSSSLLHPLSASFSTSSTNPHLPIPIHANGSGYNTQYTSSSGTGTGTGTAVAMDHFIGQRRALRMTKSLPVRSGGFGSSLSTGIGRGNEMMDEVDESMEDGFRVEDWVGKTDF